MDFQVTIRSLLLTILIYFGFGSGNLFAFEKYNQDQSLDDTTIYFIDKSDLLTLRLYPLFKTNSLELKFPGEKITMKPNGSMNIGVGFNYKFLGLGVSVGLPVSNQSTEQYGRTSRFDFQVNYFGKKFAADGFFQKYKGYYLDNPNDLMVWTANYKPRTEDLRIFSLGGTAYYIFNSDKFSYKAAYLRNQVQKKSAGSFTAGIFAFYDEVLSDSGFIPNSLPDSIRYQLDIKEFDAISAGITGGYMYTFVIRGNFFINLAVAPGIGYRRFRTIDKNENSRFLNTTGFQLQTKIALGYDFKWFYLGVTSSTILRNFRHEDSELNLGAGQIRFIIGKRFDVSRK